MDESTGVWEWDSVLETCSSLLEHDHMGQADSYLLEHILNGSSDEGSLALLDGHRHGHGRVESSASLPLSEQLSANSPIPSSGRQRKRDPRLLCPNFQAGFVPCSCPEADEMGEDETSQKRVKAAVHCQVPGCRSDITELKGYHQRHKVCLECANFSQVVVNDKIQRYCQQCGKFHPLSDFDEDKRSCRRKLERHNNRRRRRKPMGESQGKETSLMECENGSMPFQLEGDGELCAQTSVTEFSGEKEKCSTPSKNLPKSGGNVSDNLHTTKADGIRASEESSAAPSQIGKDDAHSSKSEADEQSPFIQLMNENAESGGLPSNLSLPRHLEGSEAAMLRSSLSSSLQRKQPTYSSPCPTSHLSFKFFAWNPADFPRRLREQIFEWLAKMPAELDAYVRGGCTLVTFFIVMSQPMWDEFDSNWERYLRSLLIGCDRELWGAGNVVVRMNTHCLLLENGKILENFEEESIPHLHTAYPLCLEAGESSEILIYGQNISKQNAKVLVSFRDGYLDCRNLSDYDDDTLLPSETLASPSGNGHQVLKVLVVTNSHKQFGPAYVEVDNRTGTSNFVPLLVADKEVCAEVNSLASSQDFAQRMCCVNTCGTGMGRPEVFEFLLDLGHVLRHLETQSDTAGKEEALLWRLQKLLPFSIERGWFAVAERLLRVANSTGLVSKLSISSDSLNSLQLTMPLLQKHLTIGPTMIRNKFGIQNAIVCFSSRNPESGLSLKNHNPSADQRTPSEKPVSIAEDDLRIAMLDDTVSQEGGERKYTGLLRHKSLSWVMMRSKKNLDSIRSNDYFRSGRITRRIVLATASVVTVCAGICFVSQHPHRIAEISMSLKHCLWGPVDTSPML